VGSVDRRPDGKWRARWRAYPGAPQRAKHFARKIDADRFLTRVEGAKLAGTYVDPELGRQRFDEFAAEWAEAQEWKQTTRDGWPSVLRRLQPVLGDMPLASIDLLALKRARKKLGEEYAYKTVKLTMSYATMILRAAYVGGRIGRDSTIGLRSKRKRADAKGDEVGTDDVPTLAEVLAILNGAPPKWRAAIALGMSGLRVGEVLGMTADRLALDRRRVTVDRQMQRSGGRLMFTTPKAEKVRTIAVPGLVAVELRRHVCDHHVPDDGLLFRATRGPGPFVRRDQFYESAWKPALRGAGLAADRFVFHSLRHWCASTLLAKGAPVTAVADHIGDTVETLSRVYAHWLRDGGDVAATILDGMLGPPEATSAGVEAEDQLRTGEAS
jgi:integrase